MDSYGRFYASFNELPYDGEREEFKKSIVEQFTMGRTTSLKEMTEEEYNGCCEALEKITGRKKRLKKERSCVLKLMQRLGVNTSDWPTVDNFCMNPRIAGKRFAQIGLDELVALERKLRAIERKGGLKKNSPCADAQDRGANTPCADAQGTGTDGGLVMMFIPSVQGEA